MKIIRYLDKDGHAHWGESHGPDSPPTELSGSFPNFQSTSTPAKITSLLAPVEPPAIYGIGMNYREHAKETGKPLPDKPLVFMKAITAVQAPKKPIVLPRQLRSDKVDYEAELAVVIGQTCKNASLENALDFVAGYTCANDVSARDWQFEWGQGQFIRGKTFDTFCPLGPVFVTADEISDPHNLKISSSLNGVTKQDSNTSELIFGIPELIVFLSGSTTLLPGTVILTGTPSGVGTAHKPPLYLQPGDEIAVTLESIGTLTNPVIEEA